MSSMRQVNRKIRSHRGEAVILALGVTGLLIVLAAVTINSVSYYYRKRELHRSAIEAASYVGAFLPNPEKVCEAAAAFKHARIASDVEMTLYFASHAGQRRGVSVVTGIDCIGDLEGVVTLPLNSVTISLTGAVDTSLFFNADASYGVNATGEATTNLIPTDVVIVLENSNSMISPLALEEVDSPSPFDYWDGIAALQAPTGGAVSKGRVYARQCFGVKAAAMKRAAVLMYDLLSASGTYRVGVVRSNVAAGDGPEILVPLTDSMYDSRNPGVDGNTATSKYTGDIDFPETRCGALTSQGAYAVPSHPIGGFVDSAQLNLSGRANLATGGANIMVRPDPSPESGYPSVVVRGGVGTPSVLYPRERIWLASSGRTNFNGAPLSEFNNGRMTLGIIKAIRMLQSAPARDDKAPVRRRVILAITDGPDVMQQGAGAPGMSDLTLYDAGDARVAVESTEELPEVLPSPIPSWEVLSCADTIIQTVVNRHVYGEKIRLGFLYYGLPSNNTGPLAYLNEIGGHSSSTSDEDKRNNWRDMCNGGGNGLESNRLGGFSKGIFFAEASTDNAIYFTPESFYSEVAPLVVSSLTVSEVAD